MQFRGAAVLCLSDHIKSDNSPENGRRLTPVRFNLGDGRHLYDQEFNFETHFDMSDLDIELRLNHALSFFATKKTVRVSHIKPMCAQKGKLLQHPTKKLIIKTRPIPHIIDHQDFEGPIIVRKVYVHCVNHHHRCTWGLRFGRSKIQILKNEGRKFAYIN
jgi:hypothetical protein